MSRSQTSNKRQAACQHQAQETKTAAKRMGHIQSLIENDFVGGAVTFIYPAEEEVTPGVSSRHSGGESIHANGAGACYHSPESEAALLLAAPTAPYTTKPRTQQQPLKKRRVVPLTKPPPSPFAPYAASPFQLPPDSPARQKATKEHAPKQLPTSHAVTSTPTPTAQCNMSHSSSTSTQFL